MADFISIVKMIRPGIIEIYGQFHQLQAQYLSIKSHISIRVAGNSCYMMYTKNIFVHDSCLPRAAGLFHIIGIAENSVRFATAALNADSRK